MVTVVSESSPYILFIWSTLWRACLDLLPDSCGLEIFVGVCCGAGGVDILDIVYNI